MSPDLPVPVSSRPAACHHYHLTSNEYFSPGELRGKNRENSPQLIFICRYFSSQCYSCQSFGQISANILFGHNQHIILHISVGIVAPWLVTKSWVDPVSTCNVTLCAGGTTGPQDHPATPWSAITDWPASQRVDWLPGLPNLDLSLSQ